MKNYLVIGESKIQILESKCFLFRFLYLGFFNKSILLLEGRISLQYENGGVERQFVDSYL
ncbi:hypothetical protein [Marinilabilia rubra]|uniref:Uncharacterized protein n=1 Tax=Marinilabilia rubra TaxID=2162893 RepID=A0A2U2BCX1_9BACT|nr:hypothetical protein [Marinilabilia rubra]PWE00925.1 hypothetical protein DDZ16_00070 [Marinilabilia rubra]